MTIAVTGATGQLGQLVLSHLKEAGAGDVVALARSPGKVSGPAARAFDYDRPETLAPALEGVDTLLLISSSEVGKRAVQHAAVIDAAKAAGVGHIVYTSLLHADDSPLSLAPEHRETEGVLAASQVPHTILRNGWYMENHLMGVPAALEHGALIGAAGEGVISGATRADFAAAAVAVLVDPTKRGRTYELAGQPGYTLPDIAAEVSARTGREIPYVNMDEAAYAEALKGAGLPEEVAEMLAGLDARVAEGAVEGRETDLQDLIGRPTTPLAEAVRRTLA